MMQKSILSHSNAVHQVLQLLQNAESYKWNNIKYINNDRYGVVSGRCLSPNIAITFKREWFLKFGEFAKRYDWRDSEGRLERGIGDTINVDDLREFIKTKVKTVYIMHKKGAIYKISLMDFLLKSHRWTNKEEKDVRSISIHAYERVNP